MMNNLKKVLALVLVFAMSLSVVAFAGATYPDVADDATYAEAVTILKSLGIMQGDEQGNFNPDKTVTRGEMATILCNLAGVGELAPADTGFADTTAAHWASGYVAYAKNAGWINGYDANTFGPDDVVKYEQAIKLVMAVANWGIFADENGGYPTGWLMAAADQDVTRAGAAGSIGEDCSRAKIAMILYYALDANIMKQTAYGDKKWEPQEYETILSKNLDTYKVEGKVMESYKLDGVTLDEGHVAFDITNKLEVSATDVTEKIGATETTKNGKKVYVIADIDATGTNAADLLAQSTVAYINVNDYDEVSIVAIAAKGVRNKTTEITDMDLVFDETKDSNERTTRKPNFEKAAGEAEYKFAYWTDRDEDSYITSVDVDESVIVVINGKKWSWTDLEDDNSSIKEEDKDKDIGDRTRAVLSNLVPSRGSITMIDTDSDGDIDLFEVKEYEVVVVDSVNVAKQRISFKNSSSLGGSIILDNEVETELVDVSITLDGAEISIEDLAEYDVLTISTNDPKAPKYYDIVVSRNKVEGKISSAKDDVIYVGGEEYKTGDYAIDVDFAVGDEGVFYLDADGVVAYYDETTVASSNYAVADKFVKDNMGTVTMKIFTRDGAKLTANVADKIKLNGESVTLTATVDWDKVKFITKEAISDEVMAKMLVIDEVAAKSDDTADEKLSYYELINAVITGQLDILDADLDIINNIITYDVSGDEIDEIAFAVPAKGSTTKEFDYVGKKVDAEWQAVNNRFKNSKTLSDNTIVFSLDDSIDDYKVAKAENLVDENIYTPYFFAADPSDSTVGVVVIVGANAPIDQDSSLAFFVDKKTGIFELNGDEEKVTYVTYYMDGALVEEALPVDSDLAALDTLAAGDAFFFAKDTDGLVDKIVEVFNAADGDFSEFGKGTDLDNFMKYGDEEANADNEVYYGLLVKASDGKLQVAPAPASTDEVVLADTFDNIIVPSTAKVMQYKAYASTELKKFESCESILDLEISTYSKVSKTNNIDLTVDGAFDELTYVFFRINNGTITEVVGIDYVK